MTLIHGAAMTLPGPEASFFVRDQLNKVMSRAFSLLRLVHRRLVPIFLLLLVKIVIVHEGQMGSITFGTFKCILNITRLCLMTGVQAVEAELNYALQHDPYAR